MSDAAHATPVRGLKDFPSEHLLAAGTPMCAGCGGLQALHEVNDLLTAYRFLRTVEHRFDIGWRAAEPPCGLVHTLGPAQNVAPFKVATLVYAEDLAHQVRVRPLQNLKNVVP